MPRVRRISRPLIGLLGIFLVFGTVFYFHRLKRAHAAEARIAANSAVLDVGPIKASAALEPIAPTTAPVLPVALVTETPGVNPRPDSETASARPSAAPASGPAFALLVPSTRPSGLDAASKPEALPAPAHPAPPAPLASGSPLADAKTKKDAGDLVGARDLLNDALAHDRLSPADADAARKQISDLSQTLLFSPRRFDGDAYAAPYAVQSGERLATIAAKNGVTWQFLARINGIEPKRLRSGTTIKVVKGPFYAVVSKSRFLMDIYLNAPGGPDSVYVTTFPVGLGKDSSTPTGTWQVEAGNKIRNPKYYSPRGEGVIDAEDPKNPLAGYWIGLAGLDGQAVGKTSYGIHGTIDPNSIGKMESMGCIRLKADDIAMVFDMLVEGKSKVAVKD